MVKPSSRKVSFKKIAKKFFAVVFVLVNVVSITFTPTAPAFAASYTFSQTDWAPGATSSTFTHSGGAASGTHFSSTSSSYIITGSASLNPTVTLATTSDSFLQASWDNGIDTGNTVATDSSNTTGWTKFTATSTTQATTTAGVLSLASRTGSFVQTNWTTASTTNTRTHTQEQAGPGAWTEASSTDSSIDYYTTSGSLQIASTTASWLQTDSGTTNTGFNFSGNTKSNTAISGTGNSASVALRLEPSSTLVSWNAPNVGSRSGPAFADLDNDGDKDLLIGALDGISRAYQNTGSATSPVWTAQASWNAPDVGNYAYPAFADLDNDGDLDLLIGENVGISKAYQNTGSATSPVWTAQASWNVPDFTGEVVSPAFADLDNDGDQDLLIGAGSGISYGYANGRTSNTYFSSGMYTSAIRDLGQNSDFTTVAWTSTVPANTTLTMKVRTCDDSACAGETAFSSITNNVCTSGCTIGQGGNLNSLSSVTDGHRYVQYQVTLSTTDTTATPQLNDITVNYKYFSTGDKTLISSAFNTEESTTALSSISWAGATTSAASIKFQVRTASTENGLTAASWCGPTEASCSGTQYFTDATNGTTVTNGDLIDSAGGQWFQYKAILATTNTGVTPRLDNVTVAYARVLSTVTLTSSRFNTEDAANGVWKVQWSESGVGTGGNIRMQVATSSSEDFSSSLFWGPTGTGSYFDDCTSGCTTMPAGGLNSQYFKYQIEIDPNDDNTAPTADNVQVFYKRILSGGTYELVSSPYDSSSSGNVMSSAVLNLTAWSSGTPAKMQLRTASTQGGLSSASWCGPTDCTGSTFDASATGANTFSTLPAALTDGTNDQWWQYKLILTPSTDSLNAPIVTEAKVTYVVNTAPTVNRSGGNVAATVQTGTDSNDGKVTVTYDLTDTETDTYEAYLFYDIGVTASSFSGTTLTVSSGTRVPSSGYVQVGTEVLQYTGKTGNDLTGVVRGSSDTSWPGTAALHTKTDALSAGTAVWIKASDAAISAADNDYDTSVIKETGKAITWTPRSETNLASYYYATAKVRVLVHDSNIANQLSSQNGSSTDSAATVVIDNEKPTFGSFTAGTATTNNIQYTDADGDGVADSRSVTLRIMNLAESASSTQGVYLSFSNDGTTYGKVVDANGVVTAAATSTLSNFEYVAGASVATYSRAWTLSATGSRTKTVYMTVRDAYGNEISAPRSANVSFNKRPQFEAATLTDSDSLGYATTTGSSLTGVVIRQCNVYDTDASCTAGKVKIKYSVRDPDGNESPLASKGNLHITYATSSDNMTFATSTNSDLLSASYATTTVSLTNADSAGSYSPSYTTGTAYFDPGIASGNLYVRLAISDNEVTFANSASTPPTPGDPAVFATSNVIAYDKTNPTSATFTFDARVAGEVNSGTITLAAPTDATTTQYMLSATSTTDTLTTYGWTTLPTAGTTLSHGFGSAIDAKSIYYRLRDTFGNTTATTTVSTINPAAAAAFLVQDVSKTATSDWRLYVAWEAATSTSFASYKLEYATSADNVTYGSYTTITPSITDKTINYYVHTGLSTTTYYKYRLGVTDTAGNTTVRSNAATTAKPDGVQNLGEGGGGTSPSASVITNVVPTQGSDGNVSVSYKLTDGSFSLKTSPTYEAYVLYDVGATLTSSSTSTLILSDTSKMPSSGWIQLNNEIIKYTSNATSTGTLSGITRGTWPTQTTTTRTTRQNTTMLAGIPAWVIASSTTATISGIDANATTTTGTLTWTTNNDTNLAGNYLTNVGIRVLVHDNQTASSGPLSSQSDLSTDGTIAIFDKKAPVLASTSLLINGSSSSVEASGTTAALSLTGITGDTATESIQVQFATSTPTAIWRGANSDGTVNMTADSWGTATSTASLLGSWTWTLSGRSETVTVRIKDAYGNISNTDTNSNLKNAVPEFNGTQTDADASGYATSTNSSIVIRQCNIYDTDANCTTGKVKVKFQVRDSDTSQGAVTPGYVTTAFATSLNGGAYATSTITTYSDGSVDSLAGKSSVNADGTTFTTVTAYYNPGLGSSATIVARIAVTDNESGSASQWATSNTINYDIVAPTGSITFDAGVAGGTGSDRGTITIPAPTDATTTQYMISATTTDSTLTTYGWTTMSGATTLTHGFNSVIDPKSVYFRFRDTFGNTQTATTTVSALLPPLAAGLSVQDISKASTSTWRTFISWEVSTSTSFSLYRLEYATSTDNSAYSAYSDLITIPTISTNYYLHSGLSNALYYRYRLSMKNTAGNYSVKSNAYFAAQPNGTLNLDETSADDTTAPAANTVSSTAIKATSATITFNSTDNASLAMNSSVYYAAQADFTNNVNAAKTGRDRYVYKFGNPTYVTVASVGATAAHTVLLTGLTKSLAYRYGVEVCDATGNCVFEDASGAGYTFTTSSGPAIVANTIVVTPSFDSASVTWKTDNPSDSQVFYAASSAAMTTNPTTVGSTTQVTSPDGNGQYVHTVTISNLSYSATYYYKVRSTDQNSASASYTQYDESAVNTFSTTTQTPPIITVAATCTATDTTAIVAWTTDQVSTTEISLKDYSPSSGTEWFSGAQIAQYPTGTINTTSRSTADYVTAHANTFTGLTPSRTYYAQVRSLNRSGGEITALVTCTTAATQIVARPTTSSVTDTLPPLISSVVIRDIKATSATISWLTDEPADSLVKYGTTLNYGSLSGSEERSADHTATISGLNPSTSYNFKITSADASGNRAYTGDQSFTTVSLAEGAGTTKEQLEALQRELKELKDKQVSEANKAKSLAEATKQFKAILKSVSEDVSLQDLEDITSDITDTISDITQEITPPNILGGVPKVEVESDKVTISWRTNKASNSTIALVPADEYDAKAKEPYTLQVGQAQEEVTNHVVTIPGLRAGTVYHFQIRSKAKVGPEGRSRDFVFETRPELPIIVDYSFKKITENSITVVWKTNVISTSQIKYTPFVDGALDTKQGKTQGKPDFTTNHEVSVVNLPANTNFLVEISSADVSGGVASKVIGTVRTVTDVQAPVVTKVRSESTLFPGKVERTQTIIYWETDEPASSQIFWKEGVAKGDFTESSRLDKELTTSHVAVITSFKPGSVYRFQVESVDASGNKARSTDYTILTSKKGETVIDLIITNFQDIFGFLKKL